MVVAISVGMLWTPALSLAHPLALAILEQTLPVDWLVG